MTEPGNPQRPSQAPHGRASQGNHPKASSTPVGAPATGATARRSGAAAPGQSAGGRPAVGSPAASHATGPGSGAAAQRSYAARSTAQRRTPRLAALQLKRIDPWTVLKIGLIVSIVMFFVWMIAIGLLYLSLGGLDVWEKVNVTYNTLVIAADTGGSQPDLITPGRVFGVAAVVGAINIVLFTALSAVASFVYNAAAGMAGGVEVTLAERE